MHLEALTEAGTKLFPLLSKFDGFYLAGGTALALQIGHRVSVDFDLFSPEPIPAELWPKVKRVFADQQILPLVNNSNELTFTVSQVKITFLNYPFPVINSLVINNGLAMLSPVELAATKAYTIGRRGSYKDYVDFYFILADDLASLPEVISLANRKYQTEFNDRLFLEQLVFLDDISENPLKFLRQPVTKAEILSKLQSIVAKIVV